MSFNDDEYAAAILAQKFGSAECPLSKSPSGTTNQSTAPNPLTNTPFLAKLQSQNGHCHYITTAVVKLGRKSTSIHEAIDVDLGDGKCISRKHAEIAYSYVSNGFMLTVFGKNGVFVDDKHVPKGASVPLRHGYVLDMG
ncbi:hypothetical protein BKA69DRAFT_1047273 [Paraphysoderma sedebokerense]|nr:hypothetical protein BKA69DRAFT_1047273 [Paraphysoderma sedebokerense]